MPEPQDISARFAGGYQKIQGLGDPGFSAASTFGLQPLSGPSPATPQIAPQPMKLGAPV